MLSSLVVRAEMIGRSAVTTVLLVLAAAAGCTTIEPEVAADEDAEAPSQVAGTDNLDTGFATPTSIASDPAGGVPGSSLGSTLDSLGGRAAGHSVTIVPRPDCLPDLTEVAVVARVDFIGPVILPTPSGAWSSEGMSDTEIHNLFSRLVPYTEVRLTVTEVLGSRPTSRLTIAEGDEVTLTLLGGAVDVTLSVEEAAAVGLTAADFPEPDEEEPGARPPANPGPVESPVTLTLMLTPAVYLEYGDTVIAFLALEEVELVDTQPSRRQVVRSLGPEGYGVYRKLKDGQYRNAAASDSWIEAARDLARGRAILPEGFLREVARALDGQDGPVQPARGAGLVACASP